MKNLLFALLASSLLTSCAWKQVNLKPGQMFTHHYGYGTETFIVKKVVDGGVLCTMQKWLWSENQYFSNFELKTDGEFFELGMYPGYNTDSKNSKCTYNQKNASLNHLKINIGDLFYFDYDGIEKGLVKDTNKNGIFFTLPDKWMNSSVEFESFYDLDKDIHFKYLGKKKLTK